MIRSFGESIKGVFGKRPSTDGLVRMFEVEYNKEYRCAVRSGVHVDRHFVMEFLKATK